MTTQVRNRKNNGTGLFPQQTIRHVRIADPIINHSPVRSSSFNGVRTPIARQNEPISHNSSSSNSFSTPGPALLSNGRSNIEDIQSAVSISKQTYTFSSPLREIPCQRRIISESSHPHRQLVSAPNQKSSQSREHIRRRKSKPSSAYAFLTPQLAEYHKNDPGALIDSVNQSQVASLDQFSMEHEKDNASNLTQELCVETFSPNLLSKSKLEEKQRSTDQNKSSTSNLFPNLHEVELADSLALCNILASMIKENRSSPSEPKSKTPSIVRSSLVDYEYKSSIGLLETLESTVLPPLRMPQEQTEVEIRGYEKLRSEISASANFRLPPLLLSISTEKSISPEGRLSDFELNSTKSSSRSDRIKFQNGKTLESTKNGINADYVELYYLDTLELFYDPKTRNYYRLST